jgi:beta-glucosidase
MSLEVSRRAFLAVTGGAALTAGLAACTVQGAPTAAPSPSPSTTWVPPRGALTFPEGYTWGAATSAFQVEGSTTSDGRGASIWDTFAAEPGRVAEGATGDPGADHYLRYRDDVALMSSIGLGAYRFSVAWPRIQPSGAGTPNPVGLDFYRRLVDELHGRGIRPAITLYHWDLPQNLQDAGGWTTRDTSERFADYAAIVFDALRDVDADWLTINEPKTTAFVGHWYGAHAPGITDPDAAAAAVHHQLLAHGLAVGRFRDSGAAGRIGIALNLTPVYAVDPDPETPAAVRLDASENRLFLDPVLRGSYPDDALGPLSGQLPADPARFAALQQDGDLAVISTPIDLLAVQYYGMAAVDRSGRYVSLHPTSAAEWQQIWPEGLYDLLMRLNRDYPALPIAITENGMPDPTPEVTADDPHRVEFLRTHFQQAWRAIQDGSTLEAHYVWSLLDNFEWAEGYTQRWGIVAVDFQTQERIPKKSAELLAEVIAANAVQGS